MRQRVSKDTNTKKLDSEIYEEGNVPEDIKKQYPTTPKPLPVAKPGFQVSDVKNAIPKHCFERSLVTSFGHLFHDLILSAICIYAATYIGHPSLPAWSSYVLWPVYWVCQGVVATGLWVLAHECGHQAFSDYKIVNDTVGLIVHSALLVPYFSWKISHRNHHANTGSIENDEVFVPARRHTFTKMEMVKETPLYSAYLICLMLLVGWMPGYLFINTGGPAKYYNKARSHFNPNSELYKP